MRGGIGYECQNRKDCQQPLVKMDGMGGIFPQPRGVGSAKRITEPKLGATWGVRFKHIFGTTSSHGEKRWAELQFDIRAKVCMGGWMDGWKW